MGYHSIEEAFCSRRENVFSLRVYDSRSYSEDCVFAEIMTRFWRPKPTRPVIQHRLCHTTQCVVNEKF